MPLESLEMSVVLAPGSVDGITPPPQLFVRLSDSSLRLAFSDAGPRRARRRRRRALVLVPLTPVRMRAERSVLR